MGQTSAEQFKSLDTETQEFFAELVIIGREKFPGQEGITRFHKGLVALERIVAEAREEAGI